MNASCIRFVYLARNREMMYSVRTMRPSNRSQALKRLGLTGMTLLTTLWANQALAAPSSAPDVAPQATPENDKDRPSRAEKKDLAQEAMNMFQARHQSVLKLVAAKADGAAVQKEVDQLIDYGELSQSALGGSREYAANCKERCAEFETLLGALIRENYLRLLQRAKGDQVEYLGAKIGRRGTAVKIQTRVNTEGKGTRKRDRRSQRVLVSYVLHKRASGDWAVVDIITEGVSLRKTYRYEFGKILKEPGDKGGIAGVISKISEKLAEIKKEG